MKVFVDFDDVVFNTRDFQVFLKSIFKKFGVSEELFNLAYDEMRTDAAELNLCYSFEKHVQTVKKHLEIDEKALIQALYKGLDEAYTFVFSDVKNFLQSLKKAGYTVNILSFGDQEYQGMKIEKSGIPLLVDSVIVTQESKEKVLENQHLESLGKVWFFDDRVHFLENMKQTFPFMQTVLVSRPEGRFKDVKSSLCVYQISNLEEAEELIKNS